MVKKVISNFMYCELKKVRVKEAVTKTLFTPTLE